MSDAALYHTTASALNSLNVVRQAAWLSAAIAMLSMVIAPNPWWVYALVLMAVLWLASIYLHVRVRLDAQLLDLLARNLLLPTDLDSALVGLRLKPKPIDLTAKQRCVACLTLWYKAIVIDCVLFLSSIVTLLFAFF